VIHESCASLVTTRQKENIERMTRNLRYAKLTSVPPKYFGNALLSHVIRWPSDEVQRQAQSSLAHEIKAELTATESSVAQQVGAFERAYRAGHFNDFGNLDALAHFNSNGGLFINNLTGGWPAQGLFGGQAIWSDMVGTYDRSARLLTILEDGAGGLLIRMTLERNRCEAFPKAFGRAIAKLAQ
jgi:hypothetical protein